MTFLPFSLFAFLFRCLLFFLAIFRLRYALFLFLFFSFLYLYPFYLHILHIVAYDHHNQNHHYHHLFYFYYYIIYPIHTYFSGRKTRRYARLDTNMALNPRDGSSDANQSVLQNILAGIFTDNSQTSQQYLSIVGLLYQAGFNIGASAGALLLFIFLRPNNQRVYARRYKALINDRRKPPKISRGLFAWVPILWRADEQYLLETVDMDSVLFLRFLKLGMWMMGIFGVLGMCIIVPVNYSSGDNANVTGNLKQFALLWITLYHITTLGVLSLHVVAAYIFTAIFFYFIWREYKHYIRIKQDYYASPQYLRKLQSRTVMVSCVPPQMQTDRALHAFASSQCTAVKPTQASIARKIGRLQELVDKHEQSVRKLEKPRPKIKVSGAMVDAIEHYTLEIESLESTINQTRREMETFNPTSIGFVSYPTPQMAHEAMKLLKSLKKVSPTTTQLAPHPKDIIWSNAQMPKGKRIGRLWSARLISVIWPKTQGHNTMTTIWQSSFSPLILTLYYILIPHVFRAISRYQGISTHTGVERAVLKKMYVFYFLSNIFVFTLVGVIVRGVLEKSLSGEVIASLAHNFVQSLNMKAQFWTSYVAMLEFAQLIGLIRIFFMRYTRDLTPRELRDLTKPPEFDYSPVYSLYLWVFTIGMFYSLYSPIVLPFAFLDFVLAYWVYKYAVMYVYQTRHDTAGIMWRNVIDRMIVSMARMDEFTDRLDEVRNMQPIITYLSRCPRKTNYMMETAETGSKLDIDNMIDEDANVDETLGDRFLHPTFSQPLNTPMVDKRIRHLLPKIYRGRVSVQAVSATIRRALKAAGPAGDGEVKFAGSFGNASTLFGSDMPDTDTVMDERDQRDFDGATTPMPFMNPGSASTAVSGGYGKGLVRSFSVESNVTGHDPIEMVRLGYGKKHGASVESSQADLLVCNAPMSNPSIDRYGNTSMGWINHGGQDFNRVDQYDNSGSRNESNGEMYPMLYMQGSVASFTSNTGPVGPRPPSAQRPTIRQPQGYRTLPNVLVNNGSAEPIQQHQQQQQNPGRYGQPVSQGRAAGVVINYNNNNGSGGGGGGAAGGIPAASSSQVLSAPRTNHGQQSFIPQDEEWIPMNYSMQQLDQNQNQNPSQDYQQNQNHQNQQQRNVPRWE
ncbi:hypothetical protein BX661DRAFT_174786 [Kickxella alabastrina]|uniref:uncharacterized protein n=1 Tax=Kickxella alabastrina TaxID=61397 RepID=UPI0022202686|nr:uncharacterized protein BX661DRAFT_174786 [Kickxella alabastrina]KAI7834412.1 hypothetical protein BX661DRAFT_174786 [Kickxella alabastrina]